MWKVSRCQITIQTHSHTTALNGSWFVSPYLHPILWRNVQLYASRGAHCSSTTVQKLLSIRRSQKSILYHLCVTFHVCKYFTISSRSQWYDKSKQRDILSVILFILSFVLPKGTQVAKIAFQICERDQNLSITIIRYSAKSQQQ